jgi:thiamine-monophosphate kinase
MRNQKRNLKDVGERGFLKRFLPSLKKLNASKFLVPVGDDCAVLRQLYRSTLSIDGLTAGTHFRPEWEKKCKKFGFSWGRVLGWKLMGSSLSDLAAMGDVRTRWATIFLGAPGNTSLKTLKDFYQGVRESAARYDCVLAGGDTVRAGQLTLVSAVGGTAHGHILRRTGAKPNDFLCIAGTLGDAWMGFQLLEGNLKLSSLIHEKYFVKRFFNHEPLFREGKVLGHFSSVTSLMDLSDSLVDSVRILCRDSHVGATIDVEKIPGSDLFKKYSRQRIGAISFGEDYALLFTVSASNIKNLQKKLNFTVIGAIQPKNKGIVYRNDGRQIKTPLFYQHYK